MTDDEARQEFLRGARLKLKARRMMTEGQLAMERGAGMAVLAGPRAKADVPRVLTRWLEDAGITDPADVAVLGCGEHSVLRWLAPRNLTRTTQEGDHPDA